MPYQMNDEVLINPEGRHTSDVKATEVGRIIELRDDDDYPYRVRWNNNYENIYGEGDIIPNTLDIMHPLFTKKKK